ncbi:MAG TPA: DUF4147 domain-containing protein, partial [Actinomycetota bacterium]|nr:DUF4147 domain-containing protein [Actinomycetota bacterium]
MSKAYMYDPKRLNRTLADLYRAGVQAAAPGPALSGVLDRQAAEAPKGRVWIAALGKAARPMAEAALEHLAKRGLAPAGGVVIVPDSGTEPVGDLPVVAGDHPLPGRASLEAAETLRALAGETGAGDEVWVLLSGGATSLAGAPVDGVDAGDLQTLYRSLLNSGLDIAQMNTVRKRFSRWGAGRLAVALHPARVRTFLISDVIGDDVAAIGSGPCVADPSRASEIRELLVARGLATLLPSGMDRYLRKVEQDPALETPKPDHPAFQGAEWHMVAGNRQSLDAIAARAEELGWRPKVLPDPFSGEAADAGRRLAAML